VSERADAALRHRAVAAGFSAAVESVEDWDGPSPVAQWRARDVVGHLVEWFPGFLASGAGVELPVGPAVDEDPAAAWAAQVASVQALLDDPATAQLVLTNPHLGEIPLPEAIDRFYLNDVFMHTWDLGRAAGIDPGQDPDECASMLAGMSEIEDMLRSSGQYGPAAPVPDGATPPERLAAFLGRDPSWQPPRTSGR